MKRHWMLGGSTVLSLVLMFVVPYGNWRPERGSATLWKKLMAEFPPPASGSNALLIIGIFAAVGTAFLPAILWVELQATRWPFGWAARALFLAQALVGFFGLFVTFELATHYGGETPTPFLVFQFLFVLTSLVLALPSEFSEFASRKVQQG